MKRLSIMIMALVALMFVQCKKEIPTEENGGTGKKVRVYCTIDLEGGGKSDFSGLMEDGSVKWSEGFEYVYLAVPGETPQIIELRGEAYGSPSKLDFEGEVAEGLITAGEYELWYFGHSKQSGTATYSLKNDNAIQGSISSQSGRLSDVGYNHIAKTKVTAGLVGEDVVLDLNGTFVNQIAIALMDLEGVSELYGNAISGTEYALEYDSETSEYKFTVAESSSATIEVESASGVSYVVLLPNEKEGYKIKCEKGGEKYACTFYGGVKSNKIYYRTAADGITKTALEWTKIYEMNGYEYVDLGLPSGVKWALHNVGAGTPEEYGVHYRWGQLFPLIDDSENICYGRMMNDISGNAQYDVARADWGGDWRMPTKLEMQELLDNCTFEFITQNGINGHRVTGANGNTIFLPAAGWASIDKLFGFEISDEGSNCRYWSSTNRQTSDADQSYALYLSKNVKENRDYYRSSAFSIRPCFGGAFESPAVQYAFVDTKTATEITANTITCGGEVTIDNGSSVTARGVCWSKSEKPTIEDEHTNCGNGIGSFESSITQLEPNTAYYVRAYATNEAGTTYGEQKVFRTKRQVMPDANGREYVDLGLSNGMLWATCNIGANAVHERGDYYAWGETATKTEYTQENYTCTEFQDVATVKWGGDWRMPTHDELKVLTRECEWTKITQEGVSCYQVTGQNGNSIILPVTGYYAGAELNNPDIGIYWSSTLNKYNNNQAVTIATTLVPAVPVLTMYYARYLGITVRPCIE